MFPAQAGGLHVAIFSLYGDLSVRQNLALHARLFHLPAAQIGPRVEEMARRFELMPVMESLPPTCPGHPAAAFAGGRHGTWPEC
jgi:ribosome-dependent ATPase